MKNKPKNKKNIDYISFIILFLLIAFILLGFIFNITKLNLVGKAIDSEISNIYTQDTTQTEDRAYKIQPNILGKGFEIMSTSENLILHYDFEDDFSDDYFNDSAGDNDGNIVGTVEKLQLASGNNVSWFKGGAINIGDSINYIPSDNSPFTAAFWFNPSEIASANLRERMLNIKKDSSSSALIIALGNNDQLQFWNSTVHNFDTAIEKYRWYHVAITYDGTHFRKYLDGILDEPIIESDLIVGGDEDAFVGGFSESSGDSFRYKGMIDDFRIYNSALGASEVIALADNYPDPCTGTEVNFCPVQYGVCNGAEQTCSNDKWPGCTPTDYFTHNDSYQDETELSCTDGMDNDCDNLVDCADSDCDAVYPCNFNNYTINWGDERQEIEGFGAIPGIPYFVRDMYDLNPAMFESILDELFSPEGMGLNMIRTNNHVTIVPSPSVFHNSNQWRWEPPYEDEVWLINKIKARVNTKIWMSGVPMGWMLEEYDPSHPGPDGLWWPNGETRGFDDGNIISGGKYHLSEDHYSNYSKLLTTFASEYQSRYDIELIALSPLNEPNLGIWGEGVYITPEQLVEVVRNVSRRISSERIGIDMAAGETSRWGAFKNYGDAILADEEVNNSVKILTTHQYENDEVTPYPEAINKRIWQTEIASYASTYLKMAKRIHEAIHQGRASAWHYMWYFGPFSDTALVIDSNNYDPGGELIITKKTYGLGQYSKFIRPGFKHIGSVENKLSPVLLSAYKNGSDFVIVAVNEKRVSEDLEINLNGFSAREVTPYITDEDRNIENLSNVSVVDGILRYQMPRESVVTFVGEIVCSTPADCDDGKWCNGQETCNSGSCQDGTDPPIDDGIECTIDECDEESQNVTHTPNHIFCSDENDCTENEVCSDVSVGDVYDSLTGCGYDYVAENTPCSDGVSCTAPDECDGAGSCVKGTAQDALCSIPAGCGGASCDVDYGCQYTPAGCFLAAGLIANYEFNNNILDSTENGNHGDSIDPPTPTIDRMDNVESAYLFNDNYIIRNPVVNMPSDEISVSFWINTTDSNDGILSYATSSSDNEFLIFRSDSLRVYRGSTYKDTGISFNDNLWHHIVVTWNSSNNQLKVYKDSSEVYSGSLSGSSITPDGSLVIGQEQDGIGTWTPSQNQEFNGILDEVKIYNRILSPEDVLRLYSGEGQTCNTPADNNPCNGIVSDIEIAAYVIEWKNNEVTDIAMAAAITAWKNS